jgi:hypothetical protein
MFGNTAQTHVLDPPQSTSLRIVLSAQAIGELTALCYPVDSTEPRKRELAGFLFGTVADGSVLIETVRQLPSEGGSSVFDRFSLKQFEEIMRSSRADPSLDPMQLLGWYRFHPAGDFRLEPLETAFHEKFFPRHEQVGLILRQEEINALTILVCARSQDGTFSRTQHCSAALSVNSRRIARAAVDLQAGPKFGEEAYIQAYRILEGSEQSQTRRKWILAAGLAVLVLIVMGVLLKLYLEPAAAPVVETKVATLSITLSADGPNLLVSWIGGNSSPKKAELKIFDGDSISQVDLTKNYNSSGSVTVPRRSGNVQAVITVNDGFRTWQSQSSLIDDGFSSTEKANTALSLAAKKHDDPSEVAKLKEKNLRLEATVKALRRKLEYAPYRAGKAKAQ